MTREWIWKTSLENLRSRADQTIVEAFEAQLGRWRNNDAPKGEVTLSRSRLHQLMKENRVSADNEPIKPSSKLKSGQMVKVEWPAPMPTDILPEKRELEVLFEDEHLVVINKPAGISVHPTPYQTTGTLVNALLDQIKDLSGIGGKLRPGIVHRLDKDTSGALVISKTDRCHQALAEIFSNHDIERRYWALCYGTPRERGEFKIETQIGRNPKDRKKMTTLVREGRNAITWAQCLTRYGTDVRAPFASHIEARLETGRTHQVRVHLTAQGCSLLGDPVYGTPTSKHPKWLALPKEVQEAVKQMPGQALHARILGFVHPITQKKLRFEAEPPAAFLELFQILEKYK